MPSESQTPPEGRQVIESKEMTEAEWYQRALLVRNAVLCLRGAGADDPLAGVGCLPGEPDDCGHSSAEHIVGWYAQIDALLTHEMAHLADAVGGTHRLDAMFDHAHESFVCVKAATPGECSYWRSLHGPCPGPSHGN